MRPQVLDVLFRRDSWLAATLDAIEKKEIASSEIDAIRRQRLLEHKDPAIRKRVAKLFAGSINADRQKVIDSYQSVLTMKGDPVRGAQLFAKNCSVYHKLGAVGNVVGPDLASLGDRSPQAMLNAVLDPNRAVEARYVNYRAVTKDGKTFTGVLASETGNSITLLGPDGKPSVILRGDIDELSSTGKSVMPEGIEKEIKPEDMADLFAHVGGAAPPKRKIFDGNKPEVVKAGQDGALILSAATSEIYGKSLVLEKKYGNLGYWSADDDHAIWTVEVPRTGTYAVWIDWACDKNSAGKKLNIKAGANQLTSTVASTGGWDNYRQEKIGEILLSAGRQRIMCRPGNGLIASPLLDLKSIKLVPGE